MKQAHYMRFYRRTRSASKNAERERLCVVVLKIDAVHLDVFMTNYRRFD
jgi:hypothetical protein